VSGLLLLLTATDTMVPLPATATSGSVPMALCPSFQVRQAHRGAVAVVAVVAAAAAAHPVCSPIQCSPRPSLGSEAHVDTWQVHVYGLGGYGRTAGRFLASIPEGTRCGTTSAF